MFSDPTFWTLVGFVIFFVIVGGKVFGGVTRGLDKRADEIRRQLDEAESLRVEAQKMLADYKRKQRDAEKEAADLLAHAKSEAARIREKAENDLKAEIARREQVALEKIAQAEANALKDVQRQAIELAVAATGRLLSDNLDSKTADSLVQSAIQDLEGKLH